MEKVLNISIVVYEKMLDTFFSLLDVLSNERLVNKIFVIDNSKHAHKELQLLSVEYIFNDGKNLGYGKAHNIALHKTITRTPKGCVLLFGGAEGNRTPVRKQLGKNFSGRSLLFTFPHPGGNKHPTGISSFMMHGMGKAYHTHGLHSDHTRARLVDLPGRMGA